MAKLSYSHYVERANGASLNRAFKDGAERKRDRGPRAYLSTYQRVPPPLPHYYYNLLILFVLYERSSNNVITPITMFVTL